MGQLRRFLRYVIRVTGTGAFYVRQSPGNITNDRIAATATKQADRMSYSQDDRTSYSGLPYPNYGSAGAYHRHAMEFGAYDNSSADIWDAPYRTHIELPSPAGNGPANHRTGSGHLACHTGAGHANQDANGTRNSRSEAKTTS